MNDAAGVFVVIPAYNEGAAVGDVVSSVRSEYRNVVVVDDGSRDNTEDEARKGGATVLRHIINRGQGAALQTGIDYAVQHGAQIVVTFDADGQHRLEDVARLIDALDKEQADVAVGSRFLDLRSKVPLPRRMLLRVAAVFMRFTSGMPLTDAHNGLRAIRRSAAQKIRLTLDGMAHASEIVDQMYVHKLRVTEVPVVIRYSEYSMAKGQSSSAAFRIAFDYLVKRLFR